VADDLFDAVNWAVNRAVGRTTARIADAGR
jgi:hypothetical protein